MSVGFIGLGNMGAFMARNLVKSGRQLIVYDVNKSVADQFKNEGVAVAKTPAEVAAESAAIFTMLPNSSHVEEVFGAKDGIFKTIKSSTLCVDCSTINPLVAKDLALKVRDTGSDFLDAPVSGGVTGAQNATLTFMIGGSESAYQKALPYFEQMGKNAVHCGDVGTGQATKICNNMLLGIQMIGVAEAMNLGEKLGLDPKMLTSIVNTSSGRCWSTDSYNPVPGVMENVPASRNYAGGFGNKLIAKDLGLAQNASTEVGVPTPLGSLAHQIYRVLANNNEFGDKDFGSVYQFLRKTNE
ncbi:unnamed protein product [Bursaphelenchus okinawaensis]|uniref:3-hydroxyisobutyrate dehydrogenase n=1 Tax=Bursaphelenchus okinawaensis TaxID=465554 RepID=A0A811KRR1_9BILA|nr:unnamed protein product [Bursaphelenchus okinawaensis]CAG9108337.1 unnamed protein product [Bursaphelenchus okinawaensis]